MNPPRSLADTRTLFLVIPHWRTIAAGVSCDTPAVVLDNNRVIDATPGAANHGIKLGIRRREAQSLCPELEIIVDDEERNTGIISRYLPTVKCMPLVKKSTFHHIIINDQLHVCCYFRTINRNIILSLLFRRKFRPVR